MNNEEIRKLMLGELHDSLREIKESTKTTPVLNKKPTERPPAPTPINKPVVDATHKENNSTDDRVMEMLMSNQRTWQDSNRTNNAGQLSSNNEAFLDIAAQSIYQQPAKHFVGIQPMNGPVSTFHVLEPETSIINNTTTVNLKTSVIEVKFKKFAETIVVELQTGYETIATNDHGHNIALETYTDIRSELSNIAKKEIVDITEISGDVEHINTNIADVIGLQININANEIGRNTQRGKGNFIIASDMISNILMDGNSVKVEDEYTSHDYGHVKYVGTLFGNIKVYNDINMEWNKTIVGYKGKNEIDAGYFHCPYVPVLYTTVVDPCTYLPTITLATRYGSEHVLPTNSSPAHETTTPLLSNYYTEITFENLPIRKERHTKVMESTKDETVTTPKVMATILFDSAMGILD